VFSTLRVKRGVLFAWERHYARMKHDAGLMHIPFPEDSRALREELLRLVEANAAQESTLRVVVLRNRGGQFEGAGISRDFDLIAFTKDLTQWGGGCRLTVTPEGRHSGGPYARAKILAWAMNLTMLEDAQRKGFDETILLDSRGMVSECTSANIFGVWGDEVATPTCESACLPGVTRAILLEELSVPGVRIHERDFTLAELSTASEVFVTSSTRDLLPVLAIDGREAFDAFVERYVSAAEPTAARY
jgi:branched-chain amino acid aminotransferase